MELIRTGCPGLSRYSKTRPLALHTAGYAHTRGALQYAYGTAPSRPAGPFVLRFLYRISFAVIQVSMFIGGGFYGVNLFL